MAIRLLSASEILEKLARGEFLAERGEARVVEMIRRLQPNGQRATPLG